MSKPDILAGTQLLYIVARRLILGRVEILDYRLGKDGSPLIVTRESPLLFMDYVDRSGKPTRDAEPVTTEGGFNCVRYMDVSVVWKN